MGVTKEYNKTILQTSFTSLEAIYYLLKVVKENQPMTSADGKDTIFPVARARISQERGGEWSEDKRDTHAELTLREMGFIRYVDAEQSKFEVSDLGNEFLASFELVETPTDGGKVKLSLIDLLTLDDKNQLLLDLLLRISVKQEKYGRNIRPYLILFKLLSEAELNGYITRDEWASFINNSSYILDSQYPTIKNAILQFRKDGNSCEPKKSDRILTRLVLWQVLNKVNVPNETETCFALNGDFARIVQLNMLQGKVDAVSYQVHSGSDVSIDYDRVERISCGMNTLLYGVPGSGKSWTIEHEYCSSDCAVERLVFHPDYTNADFVGQILPVVDEDKQVTYEFTPGPFTTIMHNAYVHPNKKYILIIEEINRGNAPAIFGDIFQLLDRMVIEKTENGILYPIGTSEYYITNDNVAQCIYGNEEHKVRIPSNLSILGTMNTSDQNVFTLDTAFQRRWRMRLIENNFDNVRGALANAQILDTKVTWKLFCETVNEIIIGNKAKMASAEDKRLGVYFVHENDLLFDQKAMPSEGFETLQIELNDLVRHELLNDITEPQKKRLSEIREALIHNRQFPEKVIKYLWDDAFKFNPEALFNTDNMDSLERVIRTFVYSRGENRFSIFRQSVREKLYPAQQQ